MLYIHYKNDFSLDLDLTSKVLGTAIDGSLIRYIRFFTRKNGRLYVCCYGNGTLINNGNIVTAICNNSNLEPGILKYTIEFQIPDNTYPDQYKKVEQTYISEVELILGNGEAEEITVLQMFGTTIDEKFDEINNSVNSLTADNEVVKATILNILERNNTLDSSINAIEEILEGISGDEGAAITRINASVNTLETEVSEIKTDVTDLYSDVERMSDSIENKADVSVLGSYALKTDLNDYPTNSSVSSTYATKAQILTFINENDLTNALRDYPTNSSVSSTYATKAQVQGCIDENDLTEVLADYPTNSSVSDNYVHWLYANENYVSYENIDEIFYNLLENSQRTENKIEDIVNDSSTISDISTNVKDISTLVSNVSTKLDRDYLTAHTINTDFVKNASLNTTLGSYVTKTQMNSSLLTKQDSLPFSDESDEIMDNDNLGIAGLAMNSVNGVDEYGILVTDGFEKDELTGAYTGLENPITGNAAADLILDYCEDFVLTTDISTFKPIVFCTQEEYDTLVENDQVDANTVYMLSGDQTGGDYLTPDDVSNFVTTDDISTFITENDASNFVTTNDISTFVTEDDASIYLTVNDVSNYITDASLENVWKKEGTNNNLLTLNNNIILFDSNKYIKIGVDLLGAAGLNIFNNTGNSNFTGTSYNGIDIKWAGNQNSALQYTYSPLYAWEHSEKIGFYDKNTEYSWNKRMSAIGGIGAIKHIDSNDLSIKLYYFNLRRPDKLNDNNSYAEIYELLNSGNWQNYIDVSNFITENDASIYLTDNDVSIYATTSYVDTQIGNIQNILSTI